ncbi:MAG: gliding motility-associated C-terminal domain-containing protein [Bacteroidales bacterium]|nr:gliding motility-associated C-terminal domain-containing protein [Bacteroidales bacterium]
MRKLALFLAVMALAACGNVLMAQGGAPQYYLNGQTHNTTIQVGGDGCVLYDDGNGPNANYSAGQDYWVTLEKECQAPNRFCLTFNDFDIAPTDTMYIYDGADINAPVLKISNNTFNSLLYAKVYTSLLNTSNKLTIRLVTHSSNGRGFTLRADCAFPCETAVPHISDQFYKLRNGVVYDTGYARMVTVYDTAWYVNDAGDSVYRLDTNTFRGIHLCLGDELMVVGHGEYSHQYGLYNPSDYTTEFRWNYGNGDTLYQVAATQTTITYRELDCYDLTLGLVDEQGCNSTAYESVVVRLAQNPIKTIYDLATICNVDSLLVNVGYEGENGTITLKHISFDKQKSRTYAVRTFLPDGPHCETTCFQAPVMFDDFPSGRQVNDKGDICSICVNFEHEFMGDYEMKIRCPSNAEATLKYKNAPQGAKQWAGGGGGVYTGYPYGGDSHHTYDGSGSDAIICDSLFSYYGVGLDYCFSRNATYTLVSGDQAGVSDDAINNPNSSVCERYIACTSLPQDQVTYTFPVIPAPFVNAGQTAGTKTFNTRHPSDHENKLDYYLPVSDFASLVGCPLNGVWEIEVCDTWGSDNGWIFNWSLDICGISSGAGCDYQVGLDSITWKPDSAYADYDLGHYRGVVINQHDAVNAYISSPDTAGLFPIHVTLYDEFQCVWDTITRIRTVWTPTPDLGNDTLICDVRTILVDAKDRHALDHNYSYMWEPYGQTTDTISSTANVGTSTLYLVEVENSEYDVHCRARDSIRVNVSRTPSPNFDPGIYPLEGCEPFTIKFENTSVGGDKYVWVFGDGDSSTAVSPVHTYATGQYPFKYYIQSDFGCRDSLVYEDLITVYSSPVAKFSWEPVNPTVLHPEVQFINMTVPQSEENKYYWEIQYDRDNNVSYHTLTDVNPTFQWTTSGEDISGTYVARLIAKTQNMGPSGQVVECRDTIENTILLVNDFLQFPNVVTPNGDGYNDIFEIKNLVDGMGYPNNSLAIYDRWGKRVYYKENISKVEDFWDPAKDNTPAGTYFWRFVGKGYLGDIQRNGAVEVLK